MFESFFDFCRGKQMNGHALHKKRFIERASGFERVALRVEERFAIMNPFLEIVRFIVAGLGVIEGMT